MLKGLVAGLLVLAACGASCQELRPWTGGAAPRLALADVEGASHSLADYRGKVILVNFWATWCVPCREEMPSMERLRVALQDKPFTILAVNVGEGPAAARAFGQQMALGFPLLLDRDTSVAKAWRARVLPANFVVGPDGAIRYSAYGALDWTSPEARRRIEALLPKETLRSAQR